MQSTDYEGRASEAKIAVASNWHGSYEVYVMNPDGSGVKKVAMDAFAN